MRINKSITILIICILVISFQIINCQNYCAIQTIQSPIIKDDAPEIINLEEDSDYYYLDIYSIYEQSGYPFTLKIWNGTNWNITYESNILTITILKNESIEIKSKNNMSGQNKIILNATNVGGSTYHNITITINPINDPPFAIINFPPNGSKLFSNEYYFFNGTGIDPNLPYGDQLKYIWSSDIDGILGYEQKLEVFDLSIGIHQISLSVMDLTEKIFQTNVTIIVNQGIYDPNCNVNLTSKYNSIIVKQNDEDYFKITVSNNGLTEDNISFE